MEYIDYGFWISIRVVERLKVFDYLEKAILFSLQGDFPCVGMRRR